MQAIVVFEAAPVAAVQSVVADQVQGARDPAPGALAHDQSHAIRKAFMQQREEVAVEIWRAPFAAAGIHVEGIEGIPMRRGEVAAAENADVDAVGCRPRPLLADHLALARGQGGEEIVEVPKALVPPVELFASAQQQAGLAHLLPFFLRGVGDVQR